MDTDPTALLAPQGQAVLSRLATEPDGAALAVGARLRREFPADLVAAAMTQHELRQTAAAKFSRAGQMLFTRAGYEQSSAEPVARHRAARFAAARRVADLCCGIGGDLLALAQVTDVLAVDRDEAHARVALHNAGVYADPGRARAVVADVRDIGLAGLDGVFIDPARRTAGPGQSGAQRFRPGLSEPPLDWCFALAERVPSVCIKAAPGIPAELIPAGWEAEFIADGRDLKEAVLWSPALARAPRRATILPAGDNLASDNLAGDNLAGDNLTAAGGGPVALTDPGEYLLDPNPAVTRAGLVEDLARQLGAAKIDPQIAFLTLDTEVRTPFARTLRVLDSAPWHERDFAKRLRHLDIGAVDIRRRGLAGDVDQIRRRLKLSGPKHATLVITRVNDKPWGLICVAP